MAKGVLEFMSKQKYDKSKRFKRWIQIMLVEISLLLVSVALLLFAILNTSLKNNARLIIGQISLYGGFTLAIIIILTLAFIIIGYPIFFKQEKDVFAKNNEMDEEFNKIYVTLRDSKISFGEEGMNNYLQKYKKIINSLRNKLSSDDLNIVNLVVDIESEQFNPAKIMLNLLGKILLIGPIIAGIYALVSSNVANFVLDLFSPKALESWNYGNTLSNFLVIGYVFEVIIVLLFLYLQYERDKRVAKIFKDIFKYASENSSK